MELLKAMQESVVVSRLGWTLLHMLWMGAGVAGLFAITLLFFRRRSANARYLAGCAGLVVMVALPVGLFFVVPGSFTTSTVDGTLRPQVTNIPDAIVVEEITEPAVFLAEYDTALAPSATSAEDSPGVVTVGPTLMTRVSLALEPALPWAVLSWVTGVFAMCLWQLGGWIAAERLKRLGTRPPGRDLIEIVVGLARAMHISKPVRVLESVLVKIPTVLGWLRPIILLPAGIATGLTPEQLQAILAHELAHIRRYDYLVNLLQSLAEILLFFHPAVWFISRRIRTERENCCDDIVVAAGAEPFSYAESLLHLAGESVTAQGKKQFAPAPGLAATGRISQLRKRIGRILGHKTKETTRLGRSWPAALCLLATILIATSLILSASGQANDNATTDSQPFLEDMQRESPEHGRVLHFPKDRSLGRIMVQDGNIKRQIQTFYYWVDGAHWHAQAEYLGEAQGDVIIPAGKKAALFVNKNAIEDLSPLLNLKPDDLYMLSVAYKPARNKCMPYVAHLTGLRELNLAKTNITSEGMKHITKLQSLERLTLPKAITNKGLSYVAQLESLKGLYFKENKITNAGLRHLSKLTSLKELSLGGKRIDDAGLVHLANLKSLKYLLLWGKSFSDNGLAHLKNVPSLKILNLMHLPITDAGVRHLSGHTGLENLSLYNTQVTDRGLEYLISMRSLKKLNICKRGGSQDQITDRGMVHLGRIKTLEYLRLPDKGVTDEGLAHITKLGKLKYLWVSNRGDSPLTDVGLRHVTKLRSLETLWIGGTGFTDAGMSHIAKLTNLKELSLSTAPLVTNKGLAELAALKSLLSLRLSHTPKITISGLSHLNALPLNHLEIREIDQDNLGLDISGLTQIENLFLHVARNSGLRDEDLACLAKLKNLKWVQIGFTKHSMITDAGMAHLAGLTALERLSVGGPELTDHGLSNLVNMKRLTQLYLTGNFTDKGLRHLEGLKAPEIVGKNLPVSGNASTAPERFDQSANTKLNDRTVVVFATVEQGKKILGQRDDFVARMSPFDRSARMKTDKAVSEKEYLSFVNRNILPWDKHEVARLRTLLKGINRRLSRLSLSFPETIYMIKTTGREEGRAAYIRSNAIVLPKSYLTLPDLQRIIVHELFHILTGNDPKLRSRLYAVIGFKPCNEIEFPAALASRKITDPGAWNDHYIRVTLNGKKVSAVPILFSRTPKYDVRSGGEFFKYMESKLLIVKNGVNGRKYEAVYNGSKPVLADFKDVSSFFEQVGRNTDYIIHSEEILADNFAILVLGKQNVASPQIINNLRTVLTKTNAPDKNRVKTVAPSFTLQSLDGKEIKLEDYRGKVVMLHFWATWCSPCVAGTPELKKSYEDLKASFGDNFEMISLSMDDNNIPVREHIKKYNLNWPQVRIGRYSKISSDYGVNDQAPKHFLIGPAGKILLTPESPQVDTKSFIEEVLKNRKT